MGKITSEQADVFNRLMPGNQSLGAGTAIKTVSDDADETRAQAIALHEVEVDVDATSGAVMAVLPFKMRVVDIVVKATVTHVGGTLELRIGSDVISNAIACATVDEVARASSIVEAFEVLWPHVGYRIYSNNAAVRGRVTIIGVRK